MHDYITRLSSLSRLNKVVVQLILDAILIAVSFVLAMGVRLESLRFLADPAYAFVILTVTVVTLAVFWFGDLYRILTRFLTGHVLISIGIGAVASATVLYLTCLAFGVFLPRSVPVMHAAFVFLSVGGLRFTARHILRSTNHTSKRPVIIYGAGEAGLQLLTALSHGLEYLPVALVDDDEKLHNMMVGGLRVVEGKQIVRLIQKTGAKEVLLAMPSIKRTRRRAIVAELQELNLEIKTIPGMSDIVSGKAEISDLHDVTAEDLLGRDPVPADPDLMRQNIASKVVMVSGAGGSIGSELCRQILDHEPSTLLLYEVSEFALYTIYAELSATTEKLQRQIQIVPILGSLQHTRRLEKVIETFGVQTIYHAAA